MDEETIKRINREALETAKKALGETDKGGISLPFSNTQIMVYVGAVLVVIGVYYLLQYMKPEFVMVAAEDGTKSFDNTRAIIAAAIVGVLVVIGYHWMYP